MDTSGIRFLDDIALGDERVLARVDLNVPLEAGEVADETRIEAALPTIRYIRERAERLVLCSHLGRPGGARDEGLSLEPVAECLAEKLGGEVVLPEDVAGESVEYLAQNLDDNQIMLLENLRFDPGEKGADPDFARKLARLGDVYVDDAFGTAHRRHASTYLVAEHFDHDHKAAGLLFERELDRLTRLVENPDKPFTAIMGGAKISGKLGAVDALLERADRVLLGGAMAYTFLKADDREVGESPIEDEFVGEAESLFRKAETVGTRLMVPLDHVAAENADASEVQILEGVDIGAGLKGFDIGPKTRDAYRQQIVDSNTIFWNGPMGMFERNDFAEGTFAVAKAVADSNGYSVVGGGDSAAALGKAGVFEDIDHVSTGGGAALRVVEGRKLPALEALRKFHNFS